MSNFKESHIRVLEAIVKNLEQAADSCASLQGHIKGVDMNVEARQFRDQAEHWRREIERVKQSI